VFSLSLWCLFRAPMCSLIHLCVFSYSLFFVSWNFLSASCTFWLTMSSVISMKISVIACKSFLWGCFCGHYWVPWCHLFLFYWSQELGIHFHHFPLNPVLIYFWEESDFHPFFFFLSLHLLLCNYVLDRPVGGFSQLFSFPWFNFCFVAVMGF
jgi:hypothetical protein